ncbi:MAG: ribonuclease III [Sphingomonadaceae bacterium]
MDDAVWSRDVLGHTFADPSLLERALTHRSLGPDNFERLEFLGDRVLGMVIAGHLFRAFPQEPEGGLTRRFHRLVSRETCAQVARSLGVPERVRLNVQARSDGGADSENILGDVMEALIGAVWADAGEEAATALVLRAWGDRLRGSADAVKHPKSQLQEWALARNLSPPSYELVKRTGPHHMPRFQVRLTVGDLPPVEASGSSKQEAETEAARLLLGRVLHD